MRQPPSRRDIVHAALGLAAHLFSRGLPTPRRPFCPSPTGSGISARALWPAAFHPRPTRASWNRSNPTTPLQRVAQSAGVLEALWKYLNRRVSAWRMGTGKERLREHASLLRRIESQFGVDAYALLGLWGQETAFGEIVADPRYVRRVIRRSQRLRGESRAAAPIGNANSSMPC